MKRRNSGRLSKNPESNAVVIYVSYVKRWVEGIHH